MAKYNLQILKTDTQISTLLSLIKNQNISYDHRINIDFIETKFNFKFSNLKIKYIAKFNVDKRTYFL